MKKFLLGVGFEEHHIRILTDDQVGTEWMPTRDNIIKNLKWLIHGAKKNDRYMTLIDFITALDNVTHFRS